jgi:hypothetical protein
MPDGEHFPDRVTEKRRVVGPRHNGVPPEYEPAPLRRLLLSEEMRYSTAVIRQLWVVSRPSLLSAH